MRIYLLERNWVFVTNSNFIIPKSQQPDDAYLPYFKLILFDPPEFIVWNIYGLRHLVLKKLGFKNPSLWQRLNSFSLRIGRGIAKRWNICSFKIWKQKRFLWQSMKIMSIIKILFRHHIAMIGGEDGETEDPNKSVHHLVVSFIRQFW